MSLKFERETYEIGDHHVLHWVGQQGYYNGVPVSAEEVVRAIDGFQWLMERIRDGE